METKIYNHRFQNSSMFKSYYVVWKPIYLVPISEMLCPFKSYYVVWKQKYITIDFKTVQLFKSYYVVWKRRHSRTCERFGKSLNRTM